MNIEISELESDIIREIVNIGLAKAADSFAAIAKDKVYMNVPYIKILEPELAQEVINGYKETKVMVLSDLVGDIEGKTLLFFLQGHVKKISQVCLGPEENYKGDYNQMQISLLLEVSNILTGALVTQLANILKLKIYGSPPRAITDQQVATIVKLLNDFPNMQPLIFLVKTQFVNSGRLVELPLLLVFTLETLEKILTILRQDGFQDKELLRMSK
ncbi:MAG: chemotaxis protein CheC [Bacteroidota bacterium]|nr:chemotaxis protein CheC [Bacteroidota bacterium]